MDEVLSTVTVVGAARGTVTLTVVLVALPSSLVATTA